MLGSPNTFLLAPLAAEVTLVDARTEPALLEALKRPCDAVVLDPGVLEHYSGRAADAVRAIDVPVVVARGRSHGSSGRLAARLVITPLAGASVSGGGAAAYEAAVEAAAWLARERRGDPSGS